MKEICSSKNYPPEGCPKGGVDSYPPEGWICEAKTGWIFNFLTLPKNKKLVPRARKLRKAGNLAKVLFWQAFKNKKSLGYNIDRQVIIENFIVDFFIPELGLVFEIDGSSHDFKQEYDAQREAILHSLQLEIVHFTDLEVKRSIDSVKERVIAAITMRQDNINAVAQTLNNFPLDSPKGGVDPSAFQQQISSTPLGSEPKTSTSTPSDLRSATPQEGYLGDKT